MLKRYPLVQAGNTKPAMTTFSDAIVLRDGDATRKEAIGRFVGDINDYAHASIFTHLNRHDCQNNTEPWTGLGQAPAILVVRVSVDCAEFYV